MIHEHASIMQRGRYDIKVNKAQFLHLLHYSYHSSVKKMQGRGFLYLPSHLYHTYLHCKNIWVTSTIFWSSQLHACCVHDTLQTSEDASNLNQSLRVIEKLLPQLRSSYRKPIATVYLVTLLAFLPQPCRQPGTPPGTDV